MKNPRKVNFNFRYNLTTVLVYLIGIVLIVQLFNLQVVHGEEYRASSNARLTRESDIEAARGNIEDRNESILATTKTGYSVELYKTKIKDEELNNVALKIANLLESNEDTYINNFPIDSELKFTLSSEDSIKAWKKKYKISESASELDCINAFKEKYKINVDNVKDALKIIAIRYEITTNGYSSTKSIKIAENISKTSAIQFNEQNSSFPGINVVEEPIRVYTSGSLAAHILGYIGKLDQDTLKEKINDGYRINDYIGKVGIEYVLEKYLKGKTGKKQVDMSVDGTVIEEYVQEEAVSGNTVILTIDSEIQEKMEEAIEDEIEQLKNEGKQTDCGAAVLMNVKNGEILAMCSYPTFKPEYFTGKLDPDICKDIQKNKKLFNNAVQSANAPGSTYKMVVATAALEEGVTTENEYINDRGVYPYGHNPVCWYYTSYHRGHGNVNIKTALQKSCNYFFYEMGRRLGADKIAEYARYYGLGTKTGVELTGEATGTIACSEEAQKQGEQWYPSYDLSAAIGQIYNRYSSIQMARYVSIIANGGNYVTPTLIKEIRDSDGNRIPKEEIRNYTNELLGISTEQNSDLKISDKTLDTVKAGMRLVTSSGGTAYAAFKNFDKSVAGKTGSAQAKSKEKGEYANGWFVGFTPYQDSEVAVVVFLEDGSSNSHAAKVARKILEAYYNSDIENTEDLKEDMSAQIYAET